MRKIAVDYLRQGMRVGKPLYNSAGQVLLNRGVVLSCQYISHLKKIGVPFLYIEDNLTDDIIIDDIIPDELRYKTIKEIKTVFQNQTRSGKLSYYDTSQVEHSVHDIVSELINNKNAIVNLVDVRSFDDYTYAHSVNVCILAILTGIALNQSKAVLYHLGMGALLHDMGKMHVPLEILNKPGKLSEEEFSIMKQHSTFSYQKLTQQKGISSLSARIAYEHHERYDGTGYPNGLKNDQIHFLSQITGMVDMFDAITADRVYRKAFPVHEACEMIAAAGDYYFDHKLILPFLNNIAIYPLGTALELSNGCLAVVTNVSKGYPANRPTVRVLTDEEKQQVAPYEVKLEAKQELTIARVVAEHRLQDLLKGN